MGGYYFSRRYLLSEKGFVWFNTLYCKHKYRLCFVSELVRFISGKLIPPKKLGGISFGGKGYAGSNLLWFRI